MISLLVPCYDTGVFLPQFLAEVEAQTVPFAEVIFFDDGANGHALNTALRQGYKVIGDQGHGGPARARNHLLAASRSPWVHFHDADDKMQPQYVESFQRQLPSSPVNDAWFCASRRTQLETGWEDVLRYEAVNSSTDWIIFHLSTFLHHNQIVFPREAVARVGGYDAELVSGEDVDLHIRLAIRGMRFHYIDEVLVEQRCARPGSLASTTNLIRRKRDTLKSCTGLVEVLPQCYHLHLASCLTGLAVDFCSLGMRKEMEAACALAFRTAAPTRPLPSRATLRRCSRLIGFSAACRLRFRLIQFRNFLRRCTNSRESQS